MFRSRVFGIAVVLAVAMGAVVALQMTPADMPVEGESSAGTVVRIVDGDTIDVEISGTKERIRVLGIDTPEVFDNPECGGPEASAEMKQLLPIGTDVTLKSDPSQGDADQYERLLRHVVRDGKDVGLTLVRSGWASVFVFDDNPFERADKYLAVERTAEEADRGVWGKCGGF
jgi:endonuclease YncB( thermonuclease family)